MANLQVKNVPEDMHEELRRRAKLRNTSVRQYVLDLIARDQQVTAMQEWLARVAELAPVRPGGTPAAEMIRRDREERDAEIERRLGGYGSGS